MKKLIYLLTVPLFLVACGESKSPEDHLAHAMEKKSKADNVFTSNPEDKEVKINLYAGDEMKYNLKEINVKKGQNITIELKHTGKMGIAVMGHNFVLLKEGIKANDFGNKAVNAKATDYIPKDAENEIIVHTKLLGGGESDQVSFTVDTPGTYEFLCSFAGHASVMKGKLIVTD